MIRKILLGACGIMTLVSAGCGIKFDKTKYSKGTVRGAYFEWIEMVERSKGNSDEVVDLYAKDAILMPTLSPDIYESKKQIRNYFRDFLLLEDLEVDTKELITKQYGDIAMNTGFYDFTYTSNGKKETIKARFDFWYKRENGKWKIVFHQSSMLMKD
ncbi:MAG: hypothetical protein S4CHLAM20_10360 [Chlamydiia bacterium]|nr:hypothetical protein [Chlamydiia bacterium]